MKIEVESLEDANQHGKWKLLSDTNYMEKYLR
jgi:hypothetical protein